MVTDFVADGRFLDVIGGAKVVLDTEGGEDGCWKGWSGGVWEAGIGLGSCSSVEEESKEGGRGATHRLVVVVVDLHGRCVYRLANF